MKMKNLKQLMFLGLFINSILLNVVFASENEGWKRDFMKRVDPQAYSTYERREAVIKRGQLITKGLANKLQQNQQLIESTDPQKVLADYDAKMSNINTLEQEYNSYTFDRNYKKGDKFADSLRSGDAEDIITDLTDIFSEYQEAEKRKIEIENAKRQLSKQRKQRMSEAYWNATKYNQDLIENYIERAAFSEDKKSEQYNLEFVKHLKCFAKSMEANWSSTHTGWLKNSCPKPTPINTKIIKNMFVAQDLQYIQTAQRKFELYKQTELSPFLDAAISFAAAAANINPKASHYFLLGDYYYHKSTILALAAMQTGKELDYKYFGEEQNRRLTDIKIDAETEIKNAISTNNTEYLNAFLNAGLDKIVQIGKNSLLVEAIEIDNPDAIQSILNKYIENESQSKITQMLQNTILLCATSNSVKCIERFIELGVPTDFEVEKLSPIDVALKTQSSKAFEVLINNSSLITQYQAKYPTILFLISAKNNVNESVIYLDSLSPSKAAPLVNSLIKNLNDHENYMKVIFNSDVAKNLIDSNSEYSGKIISQFISQIKKPSRNSLASNYLTFGLVKLEKVPTLVELKALAKSQLSSLTPKALSLQKRLELAIQQTNETLKLFQKADKNTPNLKEIVSAMSKQNARFEQWKNQKDVAIEADGEIDAVIYSAMLKPENLNEYRDGFIEHLKQRYKIKKIIGIEDKRKIAISNYKEYEQRDGVDMTAIINYLVSIDLKGEHAEIHKPSILIHFNTTSLRLGRPIDELALQKIEEYSVAYEQKPKRFYDESESIIFHAINYGNWELVKALKERFDVSTITDKSGIYATTLFEF